MTEQHADHNHLHDLREATKGFRKAMVTMDHDIKKTYLAEPLAPTSLSYARVTDVATLAILLDQVMAVVLWHTHDYNGPPFFEGEGWPTGSADAPSGMDLS